MPVFCFGLEWSACTAWCYQLKVDDVRTLPGELVIARYGVSPTKWHEWEIFARKQLSASVHNNGSGLNDGPQNATSTILQNGRND